MGHPVQKAEGIDGKLSEIESKVAAAVGDWDTFPRVVEVEHADGSWTWHLPVCMPVVGSYPVTGERAQLNDAVVLVALVTPPYVGDNNTGLSPLPVKNIVRGEGELTLRLVENSDPVGLTNVVIHDPGVIPTGIDRAAHERALADATAARAAVTDRDQFESDISLLVHSLA